MMAIRYMYALDHAACKRFGYDGNVKYGCLNAVSMRDARANLPKNTLVVKLKADIEFILFVESACQVIRKAVFDGATTKEELELKFPDLLKMYPSYDHEAAWEREC
jgi:hypothetical protein